MKDVQGMTQIMIVCTKSGKVQTEKELQEIREINDRFDFRVIDRYKTPMT
jgi:bifunctional pyridoxal-dependent enzyme with beta-cystathionase and maltose regulon repressor activities